MPTYTGGEGCLVDGHWGWQGILRVIDIAVSYGMKLDSNEQAAYAAYAAGEDTFLDGENVADWILNSGGLGDFAEEWLNEHVAAEGKAFFWHDGEFFYGTPESDDDEFCPACETDHNENLDCPSDALDAAQKRNPPGGLLDEFRQAERLIGTE